MKRQRGTGSLYMPRGGNVWWYQISVNGRRRRGTTHCRRRRDAEAFVRRRLAECSLGLAAPEYDKITVGELVADVLTRNRNNSNRSVADDQCRWRKHLQVFFAPLRAAQVSSDVIDRYIQKRKLDKTPATRHRRTPP